jgi:hypothetical protein
MHNLERKVRPVVVLSSSMHNKLQNARLLIVPLSTKIPNTVLHQFTIDPMNTVCGLTLKHKANILFDYSMMISPSSLKPIYDALDKPTLEATLAWWRWCMHSILHPI